MKVKVRGEGEQWNLETLEHGEAKQGGSGALAAFSSNHQSAANKSSEETNPETSLDQALCAKGKSVTMTT